MFDFGTPVAINTTTLAASNVSETVPAYDAETAYGADDEVYRVVDGIHVRFISQQGPNTGHTPETDDGTWWADAGPTNAWAFADETNSTVTENADTIELTIEVPATERINAVYLAALSAVSVTLQITDPITEAIEYAETFSLADPGSITDWYAWYFDPVAYRDELLVTGLPNGAGSTLEVVVDNAGSTAGCGNVVPVFLSPLGYSQWNWRTEIQDFSKFEENAFGQRRLVERPYRKLASGNAIIENRIKDSIEKKLAGARAKVRLYVVDDGYTSLTILGIARWAVEMNMPPSRSLMSMQLESNV